MGDSNWDVKMMRLLNQALSSACRVVQDVTTRQFVIIPSTGSHIRLSDVAAARAWLREYRLCGIHARRCFKHGKHVCRSFEEVASQCNCSTLTSI